MTRKMLTIMVLMAVCPAFWAKPHKEKYCNLKKAGKLVMKSFDLEKADGKLMTMTTIMMVMVMMIMI